MSWGLTNACGSICVQGSCLVAFPMSPLLTPWLFSNFPAPDQPEQCSVGFSPLLFLNCNANPFQNVLNKVTQAVFTWSCEVAVYLSPATAEDDKSAGFFMLPHLVPVDSCIYSQKSSCKNHTWLGSESAFLENSVFWEQSLTVLFSRSPAPLDDSAPAESSSAPVCGWPCVCFWLRWKEFFFFLIGFKLENNFPFHWVNSFLGNTAKMPSCLVSLGGNNSTSHLCTYRLTATCSHGSHVPNQGLHCSSVYSFSVYKLGKQIHSIFCGLTSF